MSTAAPRALVIGGSLAGLFTATALRRIGWDVEVFERSAHALDSRGGGIVLQPAVLEALRFAGVRADGPLGVASGDRIFLDRDDTVIERRYLPQTQTSWSRLHTMLGAALPDGVVRRGRALVAVEQAGDHVHARFADGSQATGDLLIAADGPSSTLRRLLMPEVPIRYSGYVAWRGLVPEGALGTTYAHKLRGAFAFQQGEGHQLLEYLVPGEDGSTRPGERRWNWVWYRPVAPQRLETLLTGRDGVRRLMSMPPGALRDEEIAAMRRQAELLLAPSFQELVRGTEQTFLQAIVDLQSPRMRQGRVLLLGDGAFVARPHTGAGAAKAAADALTLATTLRDSDPRRPRELDEALAGWERARLREGQALVEWGLSLGESVMGIPRQATTVLEAEQASSGGNGRHAVRSLAASAD